MTVNVLKNNISHGHRRRNLTSHIMSQKIKFPRASHESVWGAEVYLLLLLLLLLLLVVVVVVVVVIVIILVVVVAV